jgi:hypothetical protein
MRFPSFVNDLDVSVQMSLLAEDLPALGAGGRLVDLDVEVHLCHQS